MGEWSAPVSWPGPGIHAALLPTGKVLAYSYPLGGPGSAAWLFDPGAGTLAAVPLDRNIFCSGQSFLPDGRLLVTGGAIGVGQQAGIADTHIFDPFTEEWTRIGDMTVARFYPTNLALGNGRTLIFAGNDETGDPTDLVEIYDPAFGMWVVPGANISLSTYPWMHLLPSGLVFAAGPQDISATFDPDTSSWQPVALSNYGNRGEGSSVLLPLQPPDYRPKILILGGDDDPATNTAEIIDLGDPSPGWQFTSPMNYARKNPNPVILPDGKVLVVGGHLAGVSESPVLPAEIFDPVSETWTEVASTQRPRVYHSTAILLPDGRVVASGSDGEFTAEIYSPPYLFSGARPQISSAPNTITHGSSFDISTPDAQNVAKVVMIRPGAMTHAVNMEQRYVELEFQAGTDVLTVQPPSNPNVAPPGYYMLFILNAGGVPSEATFSQLTLPETPGCPWDVNNDGSVTMNDIFAVAAAFGVTPPPPNTDINGDGAVTISDIFAVATRFGLSC